MTKYNHEELQEKIEKKEIRRQAKKQPKMKVSGSKVRELQKLIINKAKKGKNKVY